MKKKMFTLLVLFCIVVSLAGCSSSSSSNQQTNNTNEPSIKGEWISADMTVNITGSAMKFSTGETWSYRIINDYQMEVNVDGEKKVLEYSFDYSSLTLGGLDTGSITFSR